MRIGLTVTVEPLGGKLLPSPALVDSYDFINLSVKQLTAQNQVLDDLRSEIEHPKNFMRSFTVSLVS